MSSRIVILGHEEYLESSGSGVEGRKPLEATPVRWEIAGESILATDLGDMLPFPIGSPDARRKTEPSELIERLGLGPEDAERIKANAILSDVRIRPDGAYSVIRWDADRRRGTLYYQTVINVAVGFIALDRARGDALIAHLRRCRMERRLPAAIALTWREKLLDPDQVAVRRQQLLEEHGLDDASVERTRADVAADVHSRLEAEIACAAADRKP